jgi:hypothetical protein
MLERDEVAASNAERVRSFLLTNCVERDGPLESKCRLWSGSENGKGYGFIKFNGFYFTVHRLTWVFANGPIPVGLEVRHRCDRPSCYNLEHLCLGSRQDNVNDMHERGRAASQAGSRSSRTFLTEDDVSKILDLTINQRKSVSLLRICSRSAATPFATYAVDATGPTFPSP